MPGAGKTTLSGPLARELGVPLIRKDAIKESLADLLSAAIPTQRLGAVAIDTMWRLAGIVEGVVLLESFWAAGRDEGFLKAGLMTAGARRAIEVWCDVPVDVARQRFTTRSRHPAHQDRGRLTEWEALATRGRPCSGQPTVIVSTDGTVDVPELAARIRTALDDDASRIARDGACA